MAKRRDGYHLIHVIGSGIEFTKNEVRIIDPGMMNQSELLAAGYTEKTIVTEIRRYFGRKKREDGLYDVYSIPRWYKPTVVESESTVRNREACRDGSRYWEREGKERKRGRGRRSRGKER